MINLQQRSNKKELLDDPAIPFADIQQNMLELNLVNTYLGGHQVTLRGLKKMLRNSPPPQPIIICEIGCGGGDNLQALSKWCDSQGLACKYIGIDIKAECFRYAIEQYPNLNAQWIVSDYRKVVFPEQPHIIFSSLFCHHFLNEELVSMLGWMRKNVTLGFFYKRSAQASAGLSFH